MSESTEEYLEALYSLTQDNKVATTTAISKRLGVAPASVTEMLKKLAARELVLYSPRHGVKLTPKGMEIGEEITRKHRLLECFLHDSLHIDIDRVHDEACAMEHTLSDQTEISLCKALRSPSRCPDDGQLIPPCNLALSTCEECGTQKGEAQTNVGKRVTRVVSVSRLRRGEDGTVAFIRGDSEMLKRLQNRGIIPGVRISVHKISMADRTVEVTVSDVPIVLEDDLVSSIFVQRPDESKILDEECE